MTTDDLIRQYCEKMDITRAELDAEGTLEQEQIDALWELAQSEDEDPTIPVGLPGAGKRRSELTDGETQHLSWCVVEFDEMFPGCFSTFGFVVIDPRVHAVATMIGRDDNQAENTPAEIEEDV